MSTVAEPCSCTPRDRNSSAIDAELAAQMSPSASGTAAPLDPNMENSPKNQLPTAPSKRRHHSIRGLVRRGRSTGAKGERDGNIEQRDRQAGIAEVDRRQEDGREKCLTARDREDRCKARAFRTGL